MIDPELDEQELAFVRDLEKHADKWIAIRNYGSDEEAVVASGNTVIEARQEAEAKGFKDVTFFRAPSGERTFVPSADTNAI